MSSTTSSLTPEGIFNSSASLGKTLTTISLVVGIIIGVILVICAINNSNKTPKPYTKAFILKSYCDTYNTGGRNNNNVNYSCTLSVKYTVNNIEYIKDIITDSNKPYSPNQIIEIEYNLNDPNIINVKGLDDKTQSYISIVLAIFIVFSTGINYYLSQKSDIYAAGQGVGALFRSI